VAHPELVTGPHPAKHQHKPQLLLLGLLPGWLGQLLVQPAPGLEQPNPGQASLVRLARLLFFSWLFGCWFSGRNSQQPKPKIHRLTQPSPGLAPIRNSRSLRSQQPKPKTKNPPSDPWLDSIRLASLATANSRKFSPRKARSEGAQAPAKPPSSTSQALAWPHQAPHGSLSNPRQRP